ncbi:hypothetical protein E4U41_003010, partial [Claviceps citrina]
MLAQEEHDLIVIGAGWFGLAAAKTYLELHPLHKVLVLDQDSSCGGTWSKDRYPDFPMCGAVYGVGDGEHIPGEVLHRYLTDYAAAHGVLERTRLGVRVEAVEATGDDDAWRVHVSATTTEEQEQEQEQEDRTRPPQSVLRTRRLVVATGLTSQPNMPRYPGQETFTPPLFRAKEFCRRSEAVRQSRRAVV